MRDNKTRDQIIAAADQLFYQQGYEHTSFAHIADAVQISRGNFYYHFKTKDEILAAVIDRRMANTQALLEQWEREAESPEERIRCFIHILMMNRTKIERYGCPVGSLCSELAKLDHAYKGEANKIFTVFRSWLSKQFALLGFGKKVDDMSMHILARSQGVATLANAFPDKKFIEREVQQMYAWVTESVQAIN